MEQNNKDQDGQSGQNDQNSQNSQNNQNGQNGQNSQNNQNYSHPPPPINTYMNWYLSGLWNQITAHMDRYGNGLRQRFDDMQRQIKEHVGEVEPLEMDFTPATFNNWWEQQSAQTRFRTLIFVTFLPHIVLIQLLLEHANRGFRSIQQYLHNAMAGTQRPRYQAFGNLLSSLADTVFNVIQLFAIIIATMQLWFGTVLVDMRDALSSDEDKSPSDSCSSSEHGSDTRPQKKRCVEQPSKGDPQAAA
ncbi:hypothetical protein BJX96DRAFT_176843 [Aspergillus floccosus]